MVKLRKLGKSIPLFPRSKLSYIALYLLTISFTLTYTMNLSNPGISFSCINANSLNMSSLNKPLQLQKIYGILKLKTDIFFVSDLRLSNRNNVNCTGEISKILSNNPYGNFDLFSNSTQNKRGVGIIVNRKINFTEEARRLDPGENYILLRANFGGSSYILGCVYGPNSRDENFFRSLRNDILSLGNYPIILGGDFNATFSTLPVNVNPDCLNMAGLPNLAHSEIIRDLCTNLSLYDPFRFLYPNDKKFTYQPRTITANNKSRIDFFIISNDLMPMVSECKISESLQSGQFDHKAVILSFSQGEKKLKRFSVSNRVINDPDVEKLIELSILETFLIYQVRPNEERWRLLTDVGTAKKLFRDAGPDPAYYNLSIPANQVDEREVILNRVTLLLRQDAFNNIYDYPLTIGWDIFFEMILNSIKNDVHGYQSYVFRLAKAEKSALCEELKTLYADPVLNFQAISDKERLLCRISEQEIKSALENHPIYEHIHCEKMSPLFLKLAKMSNSDASLSSIKNENNEDFLNNALRNEYIVSFFEKIYRLPEDAPDNFDGCIETFLGPDICGNDLIRACKVPPDVALTLDNNISLQELDEAVKESKSKTACGPDGFSNCFIKKFWHLFRVPLCNYANTCFQSGRLTDNFRTASVRLIPKKGDKSNIKNWRPISLLNCFYKTISRAVNNRLKKITDFITSRAQKGFTSSRFIHEVLINVASNIAHCNFNNISGAIVSIDQAKAFDTIYHGFVKEAYKFFGVNEPFLGIMETLGTNRTACIILDDNSLSRSFSLGTGRPQGDCTSPLEFNAGDQILLFRIELDPVLASVYQHHFVPRNLFPINYDSIPVQFRSECNGETHKAEGLADDSSASILLEVGSLSRLKTILVEFSLISGLKCNYDKTNVLPVGPEVLINDDLRESGFNFVNEITLLGFRFDKEGFKSAEMFQEIKHKITKLINIWDRYHLSLPGRIGISKSLLISQLGYIGSIVMPDEDTLKELQSLINKFILGSLKVANERLYMDPSKGGLGLINIKHFLIGLQAAWIKKAENSTRDNWRITVRNLSSGNCFTINNKLINQRLHPVIFTLASSFCKFRDTFTSLDKNGLKSFILNCNNIPRGRDEEGILDLNFFRACGVDFDEFRLAKLTVSDFFTPDLRSFRSIEDLRVITNINFNLLLYIRLRHALVNFLQSFSTRDCNSSSSLATFFRPPKGEARRIRKILDRAAFIKPLHNLTSVKTFFRLCETEVPDPVSTGMLFGIWNNAFLTNRHRDFCFKFFNNQLPLNTRVSHFVANLDRNCSLCIANNVGNVLPETFIHLFVDCPCTSNIHRWFLHNYCNLQNADRIRCKQFFLSGKLTGTEVTPNIFGLICATSVQYLIWDAKVRKRRLSTNWLNSEFIYIIGAILKNSSNLRSECRKFIRTFPQQWAHIYSPAIG
jgi:exonuclease III